MFILSYFGEFIRVSETLKIDRDKHYKRCDEIEVNKKEEKEKEYLLKEINNYSYKRNYYVGKIELSDIKANLNNGILTLTIQKVKEKEKEIQKVTIE